MSEILEPTKLSSAKETKGLMQSKTIPDVSTSDTGSKNQQQLETDLDNSIEQYLLILDKYSELKSESGKAFSAVSFLVHRIIDDCF